MMNINKRVANLYLKNKLSVQQIANSLSLSSYRVRSILDKQKVCRRNASEAIYCLNITKFKKKEFKIRENLNSYQKNLKLAGTMIYWGEGTKLGNSVTLSNSDPKMVKIFLKFLREVCGISNKRLRVVLHYYQYHNEDKLKKHWMNIIKVSNSQFCKSFLHQKSGGSYKRLSQFGTVSIRYCDKKLLNIINSWIEDYAVNL